MHVNVHTDADGLLPGALHTEVRHLGPDAGQTHQAPEGARDIALVLLGQQVGGALDVLCLAVVEAHSVDELLDALFGGLTNAIHRETVLS